MRLFFALFVFFYSTFTPSKKQFQFANSSIISEKINLLITLKIAIMDYLSLKGIMKMPKIPDKKNYQYSFNQTFKSVDFSKIYNLIT